MTFILNKITIILGIVKLIICNDIILLTRIKNGINYTRTYFNGINKSGHQHW